MDDVDAAITGEKKTLMDLPNELLVKIFKILDLPSRLRMRLNKSLDQLQLSIHQELKRITAIISPTKIQLGIHSNAYKLVIRPPSRNSYIRQYSFSDNIEYGLQRLARNTFVTQLTIIMNPRLSEPINRVIEALVSFAVQQKLTIESSNDSEGFILPQLTVPCLINLAKSAENIGIKLLSPLTALDLCTIRQKMLGNDCEMRSFEVKITAETHKDFIKQCFGVTIEETETPNRSRVYRTQNDSVELFSEGYRLRQNLLHIEGDLKTMVCWDHIVFTKDSPITPNLSPIRFNRVVQRYYQAMDDLGGENHEANKTLMGLPNELLVKIFKSLDLPSRLRMRLNKRLDQLQLSIHQELRAINAAITPTSVLLGLYSNADKLVVRAPSKNSLIREYFYFDHIEYGLERLAKNTRIKQLTISMHPRLSEPINCLLEALLKFKIVEKLLIDTSNSSVVFTLPQMTFACMSTLVKSAKEIEIKSMCPLTAVDLCAIRQIMLGDDSKLHSLQVKITAELHKEFVKECFGVKIEETAPPQRTRTYRTANDAIELYTSDLQFRQRLWHYEGDLLTFVGWDYIVFKKNDLRSVNLSKIQLNTVVEV